MIEKMEPEIKKQLNFYDEFKEWYFKIINDFKFSYQKDCEARDYLSDLLKKKRNWHLEQILDLFKTRISSKSAILIYGCGPSLEPTIEIILKRKGLDFFNKFINLTADGASILLRKKGIKIDAIFSDLDGISKTEFHYPDFNIVHAHGDNLKRLKLFKNEILQFKNLIGTTQVEPTINLINSGGFTDGDRILFFIKSLLASFHILYLIGMDFGSIIGKYSKLNIEKSQKASPEKNKKLYYALKLVKWLKNRIENEINFVNSEHLFGDFTNLSINEFLDINQSL
ncbi:MAG: 6-hydroxymethylpterin diphosphokinase MptE-like protein [Candidatus Thorarchaeota archaeon]